MRRRHRPCGALAVALTFIFSLSSVDAQTPARALAQQGKEAIEAGDWDRGCPLVEQAWGMDSELLGVGFSLAECYERQKKLASAFDLFTTIAAKAKARGEERAVEAQTRADALAPRVSMVTINAPAGEALALELDGVALKQESLGSPIRKNGGASTLVVRKEGHDAATIKIDIPAEGGRVVVQATPGPTRAADSFATESSSDVRIPPLRLAGAITTLAGGVALSIGVTFGVLAILRREESNEPGLCDPETNACSTQDALDLRNRSVLYGDVSTAMIVIGGVVAAGGIVMLVVPIGEDEPVRAAFGPSYVGLTGEF